MQLSTHLQQYRATPQVGTDRFETTEHPRTLPIARVQSTKESEFAVMTLAYSPLLGMASAHDVVARLQSHCDQPISILAHWIVERRVVAFDWQAQTLLPLFQFQMSDMSLREPITQVVIALSDVLDDWELALWFALPNRWLRMATPVETIERDQLAVLHAARAERYVMRW